MSQGTYAAASPTYIAIDRAMTIVNDDFWPDLGFLLSL